MAELAHSVQQFYERFFNFVKRWMFYGNVYTCDVSIPLSITQYKPCF